VAGDADRQYRWLRQPVVGCLLRVRYLEEDHENLTLSSQFVHYQVGDTIRAAGGRNVNYVNFQVSFAF
jgi:hypothetical protein